MRIALVSPLPPCPSPWSTIAAGLLPHLLKDHEVQVFLHNPLLVSPEVARLAPIKQIAELPHLLRSGALDVPIYLLGDQIHHLHQLRFLPSCPGIVVLESPRLDSLVSKLHIRKESGAPQPFFSGFDELDPEDGTSLAKAIAKVSSAVVVTDRAHRPPLEERAAALSVLPSLGPDRFEPEAAAKGLMEIALGLGDIPAPAPPRGPPVQAVVVTYNSKPVIAPCLQSLLDQDHEDLQITVVDNASPDGTGTYVHEAFPTVQVIDAGRNLGFAAGCNLGIQAGSSPYVALLNQDARAQRDWLTELVRVAEMDPLTAAVGSRLLMDRCPTILNSTGIEINEGGWAWDRQVGDRDEDPSPLPQEVFGASGGALLLRRSALQAVGGFDPSYFMYFEDTDLCWRLRLAGYRILHAPLAVVRHDFHGDSGATPGRALRRRLLSERNRLQTLFKNSDWWSLCKVLPRILKYDRGRLKAYKKNVRLGREPETYRELGRILRRAWTWNAMHLPGLLLRRVRRKAGNLRRFILPGVEAGGHQGDVDCFQDRSSARPSLVIRMGESDQFSLGSGWHRLEHLPGSGQGYRRSKPRSWFYLGPAGDHRHVVLKVASPVAPSGLTLFAEDRKIGEARVHPEITELRFELPKGLPKNELCEFRLECVTIQLADGNPEGDTSDLGLISFEMRLE